MFSVALFRAKLHKILKFMLETGAPIDLVIGEKENRKVYQVLLIPSDRKPQIRRLKKPRKVELQALPTKDCPQCDSIIVSGVCMNKKCPSNS